MPSCTPSLDLPDDHFGALHLRMHIVTHKYSRCMLFFQRHLSHTTHTRVHEHACTRMDTHTHA